MSIVKNKILVINDSEAIAKRIEKALVNSFCIDYSKVNEFNQKKNDYDTIILYLNKKELSNFNYKVVFDIKYYFKVPILLLYEEASTRNILDLHNFGINDYLRFPFEENKFIYKIECLLRQKKVFHRLNIKN